MGSVETEGRPGMALGIYAWEVDSDVRRREFGKLATAVTVTAVGGWPFGEHIGQSDAQRLLSAVDGLVERDQLIGGGTLIRSALEQLAHAKHILDTASYDTAAGKAFASATGKLAVQVGWLAHDSDLHQVARRCYADGLALATEAGDEELVAHTCLNAANHSIALAREGKSSLHHAVNLIDRARVLMRGRPPGRIHALIAVREAQVQGLLGDRMGFGRAVATAWREVEQAIHFETLEECPRWLRFVGPAEIRGHEARGYGDIGEISKSIELFEAAAAEETGARNAAHMRAWTAAAHARIGDIPTAVAMGVPVLAELENIASSRTLRVMEPIRTTDHPVAEEFRDRFVAQEKAILKETV